MLQLLQSFRQSYMKAMAFAVQKVAGDNVTVEIRNILKEVDRNGDGRIDYEEFCDMMRQVGIPHCRRFIAVQ